MSRAHASGRLDLLRSAVLQLVICAVTALPITAQTDPLPSITEYTDGMHSQPGFFPLHWDALVGRLLVEVPTLDEPFLYLTSLATGIGSNSLGQDRGMISGSFIARFQRVGPKVLMVLDNPRFRAETDPTDALVRSVEESFPRSTVGAFEIVAEEEGRVLVDATNLFLRDATNLTAGLRSQGAFTLDRERSAIYLPRTKAFPENTEVEASLTFASAQPSFEIQAHTPDPRSLTVRQHHSLAKLPDDGYTARRFDPRIGVFATSYYDFGKGFDQDYPTQLARRHRLVKTNPSAARSPAVEPIVYYLDPAIPEPYREAFKEGGAWWNEVFEAAGFIDAFQVVDMPADMDPMDARYHVIQWVHRTEEGSSIGPSLVDPRTGEIIKAAIRMDSYRSLANYNEYAGAVGVDGDWFAGSVPGLGAEEYVMSRRRQHSAHEIGHTLGLAHNFIAVADGRASVMDYPAALIELNGGGTLDVTSGYRPGPGAYDTLAIRYAYEPTPAGMTEEDFLSGLLAEAQADGWRFITNPDADIGNAYPDATWWTNGADPLDELERVMAVREVMIDQFDQRAIEPGEPMHKLWRRFAPVYFHHRATYEAALKTIGGMEYRYGVRGDPTPVTRLLPAADVRRAMDVLSNVLAPDALAIPEAVLAIMAPRSFGWIEGRTEWQTAASPAFDQIGAARTLASEVVGGILNPRRAARVVAFSARDPSLPTLEDVVTWLVDSTWDRSEPAGAEALERVVQRVVVDELLDLASNSAASVEARAAAEWGLRRIVEKPRATSVVAIAHRTHVDGDITRFLERSWDADDRTDPLPGPGYSQGTPPERVSGARR